VENNGVPHLTHSLSHSPLIILLLLLPLKTLCRNLFGWFVIRVFWHMGKKWNGTQYPWDYLWDSLLLKVRETLLRWLSKIKRCLAFILWSKINSINHVSKSG